MRSRKIETHERNDSSVSQTRQRLKHNRRVSEKLSKAAFYVDKRSRFLYRETARCAFNPTTAVERKNWWTSLGMLMKGDRGQLKRIYYVGGRVDVVLRVKGIGWAGNGIHALYCNCKAILWINSRGRFHCLWPGLKMDQDFRHCFALSPLHP